MGLLSRRSRLAAGLLAAILGTVAPGAAFATEATGAPASAAAAGDAAEADGALPEGEQVARRINARDEGRHTSRRLVMELVDASGFRRVRETRFFRLAGDDGSKKLAIFYESPKSLEGTAFLTHDHPEPGRDDDLWLYLPALRKTRRIAASDRGRAFLATDLSYEDVKLETKVSLDDYTWRTVGEEEQDGRRLLVVEAVPVDEETAHELGYGRVLLHVDPSIWLVRQAEYEDPAGRPLKTAHVGGVRQVDGIWTAHEIEVRNHRTGHRTLFRFEDVDYATEVPEGLFTPRALRRGPP